MRMTMMMIDWLLVVCQRLHIAFILFASRWQCFDVLLRRGVVKAEVVPFKFVFHKHKKKVVNEGPKSFGAR